MRRHSGFLFVFFVFLSLAVSICAAAVHYFLRQQPAAVPPPFLPSLLPALPIFCGLVSLLLVAASLISIRHRSMPEIARVAWAVAVVFLPVVGSIVYFTVSPGAPRGRTV